jgi:hypothetical protein
VTDTIVSLIGVQVPEDTPNISLRPAALNVTSRDASRGSGDTIHGVSSTRESDPYRPTLRRITKRLLLQVRAVHISRAATHVPRDRRSDMLFLLARQR